MKKFLIIAIMSLLPLFAAAQNKDVIYLNNGNVAKGSIISENDMNVTILTNSGETYTFDRIAIRRIDHGDELSRIPATRKSRYHDYTDYTRGFWGAAEFSFGASLNRAEYLGSVVPLEVSVTGGYRLSEFLQLGVGLGIRLYINNQQARRYVNEYGDTSNRPWAFPVYLNARGLFYSGQSRTVVPYWSASLGYTINDGFMFSPTVGIRIGSLTRHHVLVGLGYTAQGSRLKQPGDDPENKVFPYKRKCLSLLQFKLGYQF